MNPHEDFFPELRGFNIGLTTQREIERVEDGLLAAMDDLGAISDCEHEIHGIRYRLGEIEMEVAELKSEERTLEDREVDLLEELRAMKNGNPLEDVQHPLHFGCTECTWKSFHLNHSAEYGAEEHSRSTNHTVAIVMSGGSQFFSQDRIDLEVQL